MASDILHIKDTYYFEVPRMLWPSRRTAPGEFPDWLVRLDADYQSWEAEQVVVKLEAAAPSSVTVGSLIGRWRAWQAEDHHNANTPLFRYVDQQLEGLASRAAKWAASRDGKQQAAGATDKVQAYVAVHPDDAAVDLYELVAVGPAASRWTSIKSEVRSADSLAAYTAQAKWSEPQIAQYNRALNGKILIPQPFGTLRNAYQPESGFCITRYMVIEVVVAVLMLALFTWLARKMQQGVIPRGRLWNLVETFLAFVRDQVAVPNIGKKEADRYVPLLWTIFMFVLFCNLMGMIPWLGAPTSVLATTGALAVVVFGVGVVQGTRTFGVAGYLKNQVPSLGLPLYMGVVIVPMVWAIEVLSLFIKHLVLAVRLLANMVAGHLVLLAFLGIAFSYEAVNWSTFSWSGAAVIAVLASTLLSFLELFVAFLQAFIFTFLAALFIGSAIHHH